MPLTIYHNPRCSKSRETLALLESKGFAPRIVKYLETPPNADELRTLVAQLGIEVRDLLRTGEAVYAELGLDDPSRSDEELLAAIVAHPELMQRPIVVSGDRARIGRPPETVLEIIE